MQDIKEQIRNTKKYLRKQTLETILEQFDSRVQKLDENDRRSKYDKMKRNPYSFYRGSAYLFYYDVTKIPLSFHTPDDKPTWLLGDLHFDNYSCFQDQTGEMVFDVDDFDEGYLGSYLYDVLRMVVSIRLFAEDQGFTEAEQDQFVEIYIHSYIQKMEEFSDGESNPVTTQFTTENTEGPIKETLETLKQHKATKELEKMTILNEKGERKFDRDGGGLTSLSDQEYEEMMQVWNDYMKDLAEDTFKGSDHYEIKDIVRKTGAGIGSTGLERFYLLIEGEEAGVHADDVILEAKEARTPIPAYFFPYNEAFWEKYQNQGKRVISTQQAMHHKSDPYLGFFSLGNRDFYVRERSPYEADLEEDDLKEFKHVEATLKTMGKVTAKIHARVDKEAEDGILYSHSEQEILQAMGENKQGFLDEMQIWSRFYKKRVEEDFILFREWLEESF